jgi:cellulose biosynthesis protein BcsQ
VIFTFYSYKGGVGRSMALVNIAELFYRVGLRVLMVDWDLEAPGLERFFDANLVALRQPGVVDLLIDYKDKIRFEQHVKRKEDGEWVFSTPGAYKIDMSSDKSSKGRLWLLTAGRRLPDFSSYARTVRTFDWDDFYANWSGELYIDWLREQFELEADVVLIDSRTGVSEMGGVTTYQLADVVVIFVAPNQQNLEGAVAMANDFTRKEVQALRRFRPLPVMAVPARVEDRAETSLLNRFRADFIEEFESFVPEEFGDDATAFWSLAIPYVPYYAFYETVAVREPGAARSDALRGAYGGLAEAMARLARSPIASNTELQSAVSEYLQRVVSEVGWLVPEENGGTVPVQGAPGELTILPQPQPVDGTSLQTLPPCPYPGPRPYGIEEGRVFFGRNDEIQALLQMLRLQHFVLLVGPTSVGKTSLIRAGLAPALLASAVWPTGYWHTAWMTPGREPQSVLTSLLGTDADPTEAVGAVLEAHPPAQRLLLIVDQFEECFSLADRDQRQHFLTTLSAMRASDRCVVLAALRADFFGGLMATDLWPIEPGQRLELGALRGGDLRAAIGKPADAVGVAVDTDLLERLVVDVENEPGVLPILQETLQLLWPHVAKGRLSLNAYDNLSPTEHSGIAVALILRADATLARFSPEERRTARRIFLRLIQFGEGRPNTRRQQPSTALRTADEDPLLFDGTLNALASAGLITLSIGQDLQRTVDVAHEALITGWPTLKDWLQARLTAETRRRRLEARADDWKSLGGGQRGLLDPGELDEAYAWFRDALAADLGHSALVQEFLEASSRAIAAADARRSRFRWLTAAGGLAALLGLAGSAYAFANTVTPLPISLSVVANITLVFIVAAAQNLLYEGNWRSTLLRFLRRFVPW